MGAGFLFELGFIAAILCLVYVVEIGLVVLAISGVIIVGVFLVIIWSNIAAHPIEVVEGIGGAVAIFALIAIAAIGHKRLAGRVVRGDPNGLRSARSFCLYSPFAASVYVGWRLRLGD